MGGFLHKFLTNSGAWFPKLLSVGDINILEKNLGENIKPGTGATQHITQLVSALDSATVFTAALWQQDSGIKRRMCSQHCAVTPHFEEKLRISPHVLSQHRTCFALRDCWL